MKFKARINGYVLEAGKKTISEGKTSNYCLVHQKGVKELLEVISDNEEFVEGEIFDREVTISFWSKTPVYLRLRIE